MKHAAVVSLLVSAMLPLVSLPAGACGDKFVVMARCVSYQRLVKVAQPGNVLILWTAGSGPGAAIRDHELQQALQQAGHLVTVVEEAVGLDEAIRSGLFRVVLVDVADADRIEQRLHAAAARAAVLPVMDRASKAEYARARQQYKCAIRIPSRRADMLTAVGDAMNRKL